MPRKAPVGSWIPATASFDPRALLTAVVGVDDLWWWRPRTPCWCRAQKDANGRSGWSRS